MKLWSLILIVVLGSVVIGCSGASEPAPDASGAGSAMEKTENEGAANPDMGAEAGN